MLVSIALIFISAYHVISIFTGVEGVPLLLFVFYNFNTHHVCTCRVLFTTHKIKKSRTNAKWHSTIDLINFMVECQQVFKYWDIIRHLS